MVIAVVLIAAVLRVIQILNVLTLSLRGFAGLLTLKGSK
jgi:hypothetical protein